MSLYRIAKLRVFLVLLVVVMFASVLVGQERPPSRVDIFTGYSWLHPGYDRFVPNAQNNIAKGFTVSGTYFFSRNLGFTIDSGNHFGCCCPRIFTVEAGPTVRFPTQHLVPFLHAMAGLNRMELLAPFGDSNKLGIIAGGGLDVPVLRHMSIRLIQADYEYAHHNYGVLQPRLDGVRLSTGLVWQFGSIGPAPAPAAAACSIQPTEVFAGEPVTATANGSNFNRKRTVVYNWSGDGVKASGHEASTQVDTTGLAPGTYQVRANLSDGSKRGVASCNASYTIKEPAPIPQRPPTISCSADPGTVKSGDASTITAIGQSPDNRPLTYQFTASSGRIAPSGATAMLDTAGVQADSINISCTTTDDRGLTSTASTIVNVQAPPPPPSASKIGEIAFPNLNKPWRVDNTAKAILDDVAMRMQREAGANAVIVGYVDQGEGGDKLAQQRAVNAKAYLTQEKGIDPARIEVRTGTAGGKRAEIYLVPAGATFNVEGR